MIETAPLEEKWERKIQELEAEGEAIENRQDPMVKADMPAVRERVEPQLKIRSIRERLDDIRECSTNEDVFEALADWRKEAKERDKRILDSNEWFRNTYIRYALLNCIEELEEFIPDYEFPTCGTCGETKKPRSDKRRKEGYRWECVESHY